MSKYF